MGWSDKFDRFKQNLLNRAQEELSNVVASDVFFLVAAYTYQGKKRHVHGRIQHYIETLYDEIICTAYPLMYESLRTLHG